MASLSPLIANGVYPLSDYLPQDVAEATFRYQFSQINQNAGSEIYTYYITVGGDVADPVFIQRFKDLQNPVKDISTCDVQSNGEVLDTTTDAEGFAFALYDMTNVTDTLIWVYGTITTEKGKQFKYEVAKRDNVWIVTNSMVVFPPAVCQAHHCPIKYKTVYFHRDGVMVDPTTQFSHFVSSVDFRHLYPNATPWYVSETQGSIWQRKEEIHYCPDCDQELEKALEKYTAEQSGPAYPPQGVGSADP